MQPLAFPIKFTRRAYNWTFMGSALINDQSGRREGFSKYSERDFLRPFMSNGVSMYLFTSNVDTSLSFSPWHMLGLFVTLSKEYRICWWKQALSPERLQYPKTPNSNMLERPCIDLNSRAKEFEKWEGDSDWPWP